MRGQSDGITQMENEPPYVEIQDEGDGRLRLTFPPGVKAVVRKRVPVDELLRVLRLPEASPPDEAASVERALYRLIDEMKA